LTAVAFADGGERPCRGLLVPVTMHQRSALAEQLGAALGDAGPVAVDPVEVDPMCHTSVPGLSAAGDDASAQLPSVANAVAAGSNAAAMIVHDLMAEAHGLAVG
jgi:thioredoxin reductase